MNKIYDIIIIGAGPGGYKMAERAGQGGKRVLLVEKGYLGGVCLNCGCIPTKTLLHSAKHVMYAKKAPDFGVMTGDVSFELSKAMRWKQEVIETLRAGIAFLMKKNNVTVVKGEAKFLDSHKVQVNEVVYEGSNIVIATGSSPVIPAIPGVDQDYVMTSTEILNIEKMPESLVIIGGGVIGIEFASLFGSLGVKVDVIEQLNEVVPLMDCGQAKDFRRALKKQMTFHLGCCVTAIDGQMVNYTTANGEEESIQTDLVLISVGRLPNVANRSFETIGLDFDRQGIKVDEKQRTNLPNVYAIGDVTGLSPLAHSATRMGEVAWNTICGQTDRFRMNAIPWVIYSIPEVAGCGWPEDRAKQAGIVVKTASLPLTMNGRFFAENGRRGPGSVKVVKEAKTDKILGIQMMGAGCSEMIFGAAVMIEAELRVKDIQKIVFPHPTVGEIIRDTMFEL